VSRTFPSAFRARRASDPPTLRDANLDGVILFATHALWLTECPYGKNITHRDE
jgi:hypothetical protein